MATKESEGQESVPDFTHTPGPWIWGSAGLRRDGPFEDEVILNPLNAIDPRGLDPRIPDGETGYTYWTAMLGASGKTSELNAPGNSVLLRFSATMFETLQLIARGVHTDPADLARVICNRIVNER